MFDIWNLKISLQAMLGNLLSPDIPLCVKVEEGGKLGVFKIFSERGLPPSRDFLFQQIKMQLLNL